MYYEKLGSIFMFLIEFEIEIESGVKLIRQGTYL